MQFAPTCCFALVFLSQNRHNGGGAKLAWLGESQWPHLWEKYQVEIYLNILLLFVLF